MAIQVDSLTPLLEVFDMETSVAFYRDRLGFEVVETWLMDDSLCWAMLRLGDVVLMLNGRYEEDDRPGTPDVSRVAGHEDTELFFACPDVAAVYEHLMEQGLAVVEPTITCYGMKQVWVTDPDGFRLCFQQPN